MSDMPLTRAQADLLSRMGFVKDALKNDDDLRPMWWLEGGGAVKANVAQSLCRLGYVQISGHWGGMPGMDGFTVTAAGREALRRHEGRSPVSSDRGGGCRMSTTRQNEIGHSQGKVGECPFCRRDRAELWFEPAKYDEDNRPYQVRCFSCGAAGPWADCGWESAVPAWRSVIRAAPADPGDQP